MDASRIQLLQGMAIFGAIRENVLQFLLERARTVEVVANDFFYQEGDQGSSMYVLECGCVVAVRQWRRRELQLGRFAAGDCFGEMSLMDFCPRTASVRAVERCVALELCHADLFELFERDVEQFALIQMNIAREACRRLRVAANLLFLAGVGKKVDSAQLSMHSN